MQDMRTHLGQSAALQPSVMTSYSSVHRSAYSSMATPHPSSTHVSTTPISSAYMSTARIPPPSMPQATTAAAPSSVAVATTAIPTRSSVQLRPASTNATVTAPPTSHLPIRSTTSLTSGARLSGMTSSNYYGATSSSSGTRLPPPPPPPPVSRGVSGTHYSALPPPSSLPSSSRPLPPSLQKASSYDRGTTYSYSSQHIGTPSYVRYPPSASSNHTGQVYGQGDRQGMSANEYGRPLKYNSTVRYSSTTAEQTNENPRQFSGYRN